MKIQIFPRYIMLYITVIILGIAGAFVAFNTYQYKVVIRGILSALLIYTIFQLAWYNRSLKPDSLFEFPKNIKYYVFAFLFSIIVFWALGFIVEMLLSLL